MKDFLLSEKSREFFIFLFFFLVAGGFWLLQTLNDEYEMELSVPLRLKGVPENIVVTSEPVSDLRIKVKDRGTVLLNYMVGKSFYPVTIDFEDYKERRSPVRLRSVELDKKITTQLNASTRLLAIKPDTIDFYYSAEKSRKVPVRLLGQVGAGRQYYLSDTLFRPDSIRVYASAEVLDTIRAAYTQPVKQEQVTDTMRLQVPLYSQKGVKFVPSSIELMLAADMYTEKTVEVPLQGINFPADKVLRAFPSKIQVTFQIGMSKFKQVEAEDFHIVVSYEELMRLGSDKYTVKLRNLPKGVSHVRFNPEQVDFLIEQTTSDYGD